MAKGSSQIWNINYWLDFFFPTIYKPMLSHFLFQPKWKWGNNLNCVNLYWFKMHFYPIKYVPICLYRHSWLVTVNLPLEKEYSFHRQTAQGEDSVLFSQRIYIKLERGMSHRENQDITYRYIFKSSARSSSPTNNHAGCIIWAEVQHSPFTTSFGHRDILQDAKYTSIKHNIR